MKTCQAHRYINVPRRRESGAGILASFVNDHSKSGLGAKVVLKSAEGYSADEVAGQLVSGGMSYAVDQGAGTDSESEQTTVQDEMASALAAQLGQTTLQLLQKNLNIKPPLSIRPGSQSNIIVTKDVVCRGVYADK